ncbi:MAG: hypothetical protein CLLPBCKN_001201 [Chroococcidiopsis cubana SAG 39.79]|uniref:Uncharacterized protein n=1 Tax=Chroococcidiopsis cubana SAG 39.79 TaxID=388085 RepID=A0AB37UHM3_9CYAN|nr:winged helix-turn-helix transcriptional regulator [Chroococcidiopsis cubana]MDZ4871813.1 hypothetical protein [Chroococcidiopsis cubana SAG 39.79]RUT10764.1 hypothetical protein DSM107010_38820 [Chroococcidiopsis cubana SAG 39.79]
MTTTESYSTKQEILAYLLKQGQATAQQLAKALSISRQATQRHLKNLQNEQLIEYQPMPVGMGRPGSDMEVVVKLKSCLTLHCSHE